MNAASGLQTHVFPRTRKLKSDGSRSDFYDKLPPVLEVLRLHDAVPVVALESSLQPDAQTRS